VKRNHPYVKPLERVMTEAGVTQWKFGDHRKHCFLEMTVNDRSRLITFAATPSEYRGLENTIALARRTIRTLL